MQGMLTSLCGIHEEKKKFIEFFKSLKPIFHCDAKYLASGIGVGQCPRRQNFVLEIPTCWYILGLPNAKICSSPAPTPDASQWDIGGVGSSVIGHV